MNTLTGRLRLAADYLHEHGWTQGEEQDCDGRVCLTGAVRLCAPQTGDEYLIRAVLRRRDRAENWNDRLSPTGSGAAAVEELLRTAEITDADLAETFGPQWEAIVVLVRRAAALTVDEALGLSAARAAAWDAARAAAAAAAGAAAGVAAREAARVAAREAARAAAGDAARDAAWAAAWDAAWDAAWAAAGVAAADAAWALAVRDFIGQHDLIQEHYDLLTRPWASVIGSVHPDDLILSNKEN